MPTIMAVGSQKSGVVKSAVTVDIAAAFGKMGQKVLLVDLDPQEDADSYLGYKKDKSPSIFDLLKWHIDGDKTRDYGRAIRHSNKKKIDFIPADERLEMFDALLAGVPSQNMVLKGLLESPVFERHDYIFVNVSGRGPGLMPNALTAAHFVIIPVTHQDVNDAGVEQMMAYVDAANKSANPRLEVVGILPTTGVEGVVLQGLGVKYPELVLKNEVPWLQKAHFGHGGSSYVKCAQELVENEIAIKSRVLGIKL